MNVYMKKKAKAKKSKPSGKRKAAAKKSIKKSAKKSAKKPAASKRAVSSGSAVPRVGRYPGLRVLGGERAGFTFLIAEGNNLVGRWDPEDGAFPEIDLEQVDPEAKISRKHCVIERKGTSVTIEDVGSLNGTYVNQSRQLKSGETYTLKEGDEILIGRTLLRFEFTSEV